MVFLIVYITHHIAFTERLNSRFDPIPSTSNAPSKAITSPTQQPLFPYYEEPNSSYVSVNRTCAPQLNLGQSVHLNQSQFHSSFTVTTSKNQLQTNKRISRYNMDFPAHHPMDTLVFSHPSAGQSSSTEGSQMDSYEYGEDSYLLHIRDT